MEYGLGEIRSHIWEISGKVLILVVMEYGLGVAMTSTVIIKR